MNTGDEVAGRYRLEELVGHGPMSEVWRAHDDTLDRTVALKMLAPAADLGRFRREARAVASLADEHVMRVYDYGEGASGPYMAFEWLPGGTLEERLGGGALSPAVTRRLAMEIASGLAHLHERGFVHRDLKPANVLFDQDDRAKLADFGLVRSAVGPGALTEAGMVLGTAAYISPEQAAGEAATPASDVYSFGVVLFRMLTGTLPFVDGNALTLVEMHRNTPPPSVRSVNPMAPPELAALADSSLAKDPFRRPADGAALLAALEAMTTGINAADTAATRVLPTVAAPRTPRARMIAAAAALLLLAALGGLLSWALTHSSGAGSHAGIASTTRKHTRTTPFVAIQPQQPQSKPKPPKDIHPKQPEHPHKKPEHHHEKHPPHAHKDLATD